MNFSLSFGTCDFCKYSQSIKALRDCSGAVFSKRLLLANWIQLGSNSMFWSIWRPRRRQHQSQSHRRGAYHKYKLCSHSITKFAPTHLKISSLSHSIPLVGIVYSHLLHTRRWTKYSIQYIVHVHIALDSWALHPHNSSQPLTAYPPCTRWASVPFCDNHWWDLVFLPSPSLDSLSIRR